MYLLEQILNGVCQGMIYALMAIGYSTIVGVTGLVTFAYGEVVMIGAFAAYYCFEFFGAHLVPALLAGFLMAGLGGVVIHKVCYEHFFDAPRHISLICTIGMSMLLKNLAQILFGSQVKGMPTFFGGRFISLGGIRISFLQLLIFGLVIGLSAALSIFLNRTRTGMTLRSVSQDKKAAALVGIDVERSTLTGNVLGCALGGVGGVLLGIYYGTIVPTMGGAVGMKAFSASVLGVLTDVAGAAIGGLLIGICENIGIMFMTTGLRDAIAFVFLILVLLVKPQGLFGRKGGIKL